MGLTLVSGCSVRARQRHVWKRIVIVIPAVLQTLVLASSSIGVRGILWMIGAGPLSPVHQIALEKVNIMLMGVASLATLLVGLGLAVASCHTSE